MSNNVPPNIEPPAAAAAVSIAPPNVSVGDQSPQHNPHAYSVFAPVIIPERNGGSTWTGQHRAMDNGEVAPAPHLPKKPAAHVWMHNSNAAASTDALSPAVIDLPGATVRDPLWNNSDIFVTSEASDVLPASPLPKRMISPRHEAAPPGNRSPFHGRGPQTQYSPTHSIASTVTLIGGTSGGALGDVSPQLGTFYYNNEHGHGHGQSQMGAVPISPHVNVPTATTMEYRAVPPPLPPRRKERTESCADMAQKSQAPDAPTVSKT